MERLTTEQIADMKEYFSRSKEVKTSSLAMKLSHDGLKLIDTIEAQQQEIEQLKEVNRQLMWENISDNMSENITAEQAEQIKALTADKDEQAGRIMQYDAVLRQARQILSGVNVARCPYCWGKDTHHENCDIKIVIDAIDALLGGKEDAENAQT